MFLVYRQLPISGEAGRQAQADPGCCEFLGSRTRDVKITYRQNDGICVYTYIIISNTHCINTHTHVHKSKITLCFGGLVSPTTSTMCFFLWGALLTLPPRRFGQTCRQSNVQSGRLRSSTQKHRESNRDAVHLLPQSLRDKLTFHVESL